MSTTWDFFGLWPVRALIAGGAVLLVGRALLLLSRQPARRVWVGTAAVVAALLVIPLTAMPGWVPVTVPVADPASKAQDQSLNTSRTQTSFANETRDPAEIAAEASFLPSPALRGRGAGGEGVKARSVKNELSDVASPNPLTPTLSPEAGEREPECGFAVLRAPACAENHSDEAAPAQATISNRPSFNWLAIATWAYGLIVAGLLIRLAFGHVALNRLWRMAYPAPAWAESIFRRLAEPVCPQARLRVFVRGGGPLCFGVVRPRVLMPATLLASGDGPLLRAVFAHELAHLSRRDPLAGWLLGLARAAYFVCPWLPGIRREVRVAQECLADAAAVPHAAGPTEYAELLIRMARSRPAPLGAAGARGSSSELYRRVTMLLRTRGSVERRCPRRWAVALGGGLTALAVLAAGLSIQPRSIAAAEPEKKPADKKEPKEAPKPAARPDLLKEMLEKLQKDAGDDPETQKRIEQLKKALQPVERPDPVAPPGGLPPFPPPGILLPAFPDDAGLKELLKGQDDLLRQLQGMLGQGGLRGGAIGGFNVGPDGVTPLFPPAGGVRLGVRVERPSDVLASQLDLKPGQGLVCTDVPAESVAGKAGIKPHDILLEIGGKPISSNFPDFQKALSEVKADTVVDFVVLRKGKKETIKGVKLPEAKAFPEIGVLPGIDGPLPLFPPGPPRGIPGTPIGRLPGAGAAATVTAGPGETVRVEQVNDAFTVFYSKNGIKVTIAGSKEGGEAKPESIEVDDNGKTTRAESIDKLPKEFQELAKAAIKAVK